MVEACLVRSVVVQCTCTCTCIGGTCILNPGYTATTILGC